ncbi:MAG: YegS/Rv2252/BmrU family lipid kinase [Anaerolineae bacterium]|nr:YegS/Rv2252/BmrU family lipid kinase [Anaerolineae bacterium]MDK1079864.1 YegS/Rv2252/BmrU family lipid kinase [Anaerolineae bacterium]MDK1119288.1 YegS/Rv2252/BmrU family lipid kinase [Anaerolineae bacterium]
MREALVVYNPAAGRFPVKPHLKAIESELAKAGWKTEILATKSGEHAVQLGKQAAAEKLDAVFTVGGDGTIGQVSSGLIGSETALGVLPAGTSNVWANELGLAPFTLANPGRLRENARILANSSIQKVDVGSCNDHSFMMWTGLGLDALAIRSIKLKSRFEKFFAVPAHAVSIIWNASRWKGMQLRIWADGREMEGHYLLLIANNIRTYMGGLSTLSPNAYLDDGLLDLWLFRGENLADALRIVYDLRSGHHLKSSKAQHITFQSLRVQADSPFFIHMDAESKEATQEAKITVIKRSLRLLMPPNSLHLLQNASKNVT